ncbi:MAG: hypothetical protein PWP76_139 [Candidatus Diapherotrites archaeon]|nr:hypothetical protein [Candidatus Diapherotrites archaeon]
MERKYLRAGLIIATLAIAGWLMGDAAERGDVLLFTVEWLIAAAIVVAITTVFGPVQTADERAVARSKDAALIAVRWSAVVGLIGAAYANMLNLTAATVFLTGMMFPGLLWTVAYFILNWRDTH